MDPLLARAQLLLEQSRYDLAEQELKQALTANPNHALAHALLAICHLEQEKFDDATREAQTAIGLEPDLSYAYYVFGLVLQRRRRFDEAMKAATEALALDPSNTHFHALVSQIHMDERRWPQALEAAERGLELNAEDVTCNNLRAGALIKLGRRAEAGATIDGVLARSPEDASTHAMQGWALLHSGNPKKAMEHFRESLRLEPDSDWAKAGIVEALKARNFFYGLMLRYFLFMSRMSGRMQWAIILGGYFGNQLLRRTAEANPRLAPFIWPIVIAYVAFCLMTWISYPLFNLFLRLHPFGKYALSADQKRGANWVGACVFLAVVSLVAWLGFKVPLADFASITFGFLLLPLSGTVSCHEGWPRRLMTVYTALLFSSMLACVLIVLFWTGTMSTGQVLVDRLNNLFLWGCVLSGFVVNAVARIRPRR